MTKWLNKLLIKLVKWSGLFIGVGVGITFLNTLTVIEYTIAVLTWQGMTNQQFYALASVIGSAVLITETPSILVISIGLWLKSISVVSK